MTAGMDWRDSAACLGKTPAFFAVPIGGMYLQRRRPALDPYAQGRAICAGCPVRQDCLDEALRLARDGHQVDGLWGGLDERQRRDIGGRRQHVPKAPAHGTPRGYTQHRRIGEQPCDACTDANRLRVYAS